MLIAGAKELNSVLQIVRFMVLLCFFLELGILLYCFIAVVPNLGVNYPRGVICDFSVGNVTPPTC